MKKLIASLFLLSTMVVCAEESVTAIDKQVTGVNKEQLERKEIETKEMLLKNQNINTGLSIFSNNLTNFSVVSFTAYSAFFCSFSI